MKYLDSHSNTIEDNVLIKVTFENGQQGVAIFGHISCINDFDFDKKRLSRCSIGGNLDTRKTTVEEAVQAYNNAEENSIIAHIRTKRITSAELMQ